jgi:hypothetical protein
VSLDGYFTGENGDIGWFKDHGTEMPSSTGAAVHWPERRLHLLWQSLSTIFVHIFIDLRGRAPEALEHLMSNRTREVF